MFCFVFQLNNVFSYKNYSKQNSLEGGDLAFMGHSWSTSGLLNEWIEETRQLRSESCVRNGEHVGLSPATCGC